MSSPIFVISIKLELLFLQFMLKLISITSYTQRIEQRNFSKKGFLCTIMDNYSKYPEGINILI